MPAAAWFGHEPLLAGRFAHCYEGSEV